MKPDSVIRRGDFLIMSDSRGIMAQMAVNAELLAQIDQLEKSNKAGDREAARTLRAALTGKG